MAAPKYQPRWLPLSGWGVLDTSDGRWVQAPDGTHAEDDCEALAAELNALPGEQLSDNTGFHCRDKRRFTRKRALQAAAKMAKNGEPYEAFHCLIHHCWHIGHPRGWRAVNGRPRRGVLYGPGAPPEGIVVLYPPKRLEPT